MDDHDLDEYDESFIKPDDFDQAFHSASAKLNSGIKLRVTKIKSSPGVVQESPKVFKSNARSLAKDLESRLQMVHTDESPDKGDQIGEEQVNEKDKQINSSNHKIAVK